MADRPSSTTNNTSEDKQSPWHTPETPGGWRVPKAAEEVVGWSAPAEKPAEEQVGWQVPALPQDLDVVPEDKGAWHLPSPEDTTFKPEDQITITEPAETAATPADEPIQPETEAALLVEDEASPEEVASLEAEAAEPETALPFDDVPGTTSSTAPTQAEPEAAALPFDGQPDGAAQSETVTPGLVYDDDDDDGDSFSMSELMALASLVEDQPGANIATPADASPAATSATQAAGVETPATQAAAPASPNDPAEYARQQLARLQAEQAAQQAVSPTAAVSAVNEEPASQPPSETSAMPPVPVTPERI
jgi:hypothetical protein